MFQGVEGRSCESLVAFTSNYIQITPLKNVSMYEDLNATGLSGLVCSYKKKINTGLGIKLLGFDTFLYV